MIWRPRAATITCLIGIATLMAGVAQWHWFAELFSHFKPQLAFSALAMAMLLYAIGARRWAWLALALGCWNGYPVAASLLARGESPPRIGREISVAHANVHMNPDALAQLMQWLDSSQPGVDVVVLLEATPSFEPSLHKLRPRFPHQLAELRDSPFGIVMLSRISPVHTEIKLDNSKRPLAIMKFTGAESTMSLYAAHPPPPISGELAAERNRELEAIAAVIRKDPSSHQALVGDLNLTPWSPYFPRLLTESGLRDARTGLGMQNTWPAIPGVRIIGIAIDHTLVSQRIAVIERIIGPAIGSDHLPVLVRLAY